MLNCLKMKFVYPYRRKENDFNINQSIRCVLKYYPNAEIFVIGDKPENDFKFTHIKSHDSYLIRGANVTSKIMQFARMYEGEFVYMNDDFFINDKFDFNIVHGSYEMMERKEGKASIAWNQAVDNTVHYLEHNKKPIRSYECHQPVVFNSRMLIDTMDQINWVESDHFIKSLYFNINVPIRFNPIDNVKLTSPNIAKANIYLEMFGCLSTGNGFMTEKGANYIKQI